MIRVFTIGDALSSLCPGVEWSIYGNDYNTLIFHNSEEKPTLEQLQLEIKRLQQEYDNKLFQRQRATEYPPLQDLADALYWQSKGDNSKMEAYVAACEAVKEKYPKGV